MKLKTFAAKFIDNLSQIYSEDEVQAIFLISVAHFLKIGRAEYLLKKEEELTEENSAQLELVIDELKAGKPIQYIIGETEFYNLTFKVNSTVLIPRPETEELVEWIINTVKSLPVAIDRESSKSAAILDIGTGSGCIAIALKKNLPQIKVFALDISEESLITARANAALNNVDVEFIHQDILQPSAHQAPTQYTLIVSNPPYIKEDEKPAMHHNVLANEPHGALFVSNEDPLVFYNAIADFALKNLTNNGMLFFEINEYLGQQTVNLLNDKGFKNIILKKDMQGKDRMIYCLKN